MEHHKMTELNLNYFHYSLINLVRSAIDGEATSIAIRVNIKYCRIQIVDNAIGFSFDILQHIGEYNKQKLYCGLNNSNQDHYYYFCHQNYFAIQNLEAMLIIATKSRNSDECYEKVLRKGYLSRIKAIMNRPIHGTTLTMYFPENIIKKNFDLSIFIREIDYFAKNYPKVSFSIRDDNKLEMILKIKKQYKDNLKKKKYFQESTRIKSFVFSTLNFKKLLPTNVRNNDNKSFFNYGFSSVILNDKSLIMKTKSSSILQKTEAQIVEKMELDSEFVPSQWSDWELQSPNTISSHNFQQSSQYNFTTVNEMRRYRFLPAKLTNLLPVNIHRKLINHQMTQEFNTCGIFNNFHNLPRRQDLQVRPCNKLMKLEQWEITLDHDTLKHMEVINQINSEFIAATILKSDKKLLILIDQHAMHERIRYEDLLKDYKNDKNQLTSIKLERIIKIDAIPAHIYEQILKNSKIFIHFGLKLTWEMTTKIIIIKTIPKCLQRKKNNSTLLISIVRQLLMEIIDRLTTGIGFSNLPLTIHNEIASEACHGAIKFGDSLNIHQCKVMVNYWKQTNLPNRCAHGRPVIVPLLSIDN